MFEPYETEQTLPQWFSSSASVTTVLMACALALLWRCLEHNVCTSNIVIHFHTFANKIITVWKPVMGAVTLSGDLSVTGLEAIVDVNIKNAFWEHSKWAYSWLNWEY